MRWVRPVRSCVERARRVVFHLSQMGAVLQESASARELRPVSAQDEGTEQAGLSARRACIALVAIAALSACLRFLLLAGVPGPFVFLDELGYQQLAKSIGESGR